jgi:hypothetical protein
LESKTRTKTIIRDTPLITEIKSNCSGSFINDIGNLNFINKNNLATIQSVSYMGICNTLFVLTPP